METEIGVITTRQECQGSPMASRSEKTDRHAMDTFPESPQKKKKKKKQAYQYMIWEVWL